MKQIKYIIKYKEFGSDKWGETSYMTPEPVTEEYLVEFFGLFECEDYKIEIENN